MECERYSITEDCWRQIKPMNVRRNGAGSVNFPEQKCIFVFGGNNQQNGSLDSIEKYSIVYDKWDIMNIKLHMPLHDLNE